MEIKSSMFSFWAVEFGTQVIVASPELMYRYIDQTK